ncbi:MAG: glutathione S-transferase family protein [Betaproteobacteria bacterium]|nr:glutathione S-transferase family protein [Betaproteobacteria bacterium]
MTIRLYDLAGAEDERRFSPYCWRVKMALAHKGLAFDTVPWRFTEKEVIAFSGSTTVPVIVDGERVVADSWKIALYLDEAYGDRSPLIDSEQARGAVLAFRFWCEQNAHPAVMRVIMPGLFANLHDKDKAYFRASREKRFGASVEALGADPAGSLAAFRRVLEPVRSLLALEPFVGGAAPGFADYILFGVFQWARVMSPVRLLAPEDALYPWRERLLDLHGGLARRAMGHPV